MRNVCQILAVKPEGKRLLTKLKYIWEDNIKMVLKGIGWKDMDWMHLAEDREQWWAFVNMLINFP
jgi:hypothetical protein